MSELKEGRLYQDAMPGTALLHYPINTFPQLPALSQYYPVQIAQSALAHWHCYLSNKDNEQKEAFLTQAFWLLTHQSHFTDNTGGWLIPLTLANYDRPQYVLSALAQGLGISVLIRAYQLTGDDAFLQAAQQAVRTFELDILDGGVNTPIGNNGIFFEEIAVYPATHVLSSYILALFGLYDYVAITKDSKIEDLIAGSLAAFHSIIDEFDAGYWTYTALLHRRLASLPLHSFHILLLEALTTYSGCQHCSTLARRWTNYQYFSRSRFRYQIMRLATKCYDHYLHPALHRVFFKAPYHPTYNSPHLVCVPIHAFPVPGGMKSVLAGVAETMHNQWQMTYVTNCKGPETAGLQIKEFGQRGITSYWQFPNVWLYCFTGAFKLFKLLRGSGFSLILPQDGLYTAAFSALVGKLLNIRVVCMDHGTVTLPDSLTFHRERKCSIEAYSWPRRLLARLRLVCYWPSLRLLAQIATPMVDHFLIAGDEVEATYRNQFGVRASRITRYAYIVDITRFASLDQATRTSIRMEQGISADAIVITMINRLAPEKGLSFALKGIAQTMSELSPAIRKRVKVLIAGDGPLRDQVEADIPRYGLNEACILWGVANSSDVPTLLGLSNIFLYSGTRGTNYSMAVLEAMAAGCAVVASTSPQSNASLLAHGRGLAITPGNAQAISSALTLLCNDLELCQHMGQSARAYVATYHSTATLTRTLLRTSFFIPTLTEQKQYIGDIETC
jgi:glycosyltransferase involved in cell wall biosynthesis